MSDTEEIPEYEVTLSKNEITVSAMFSLFDIIRRIEADWSTVKTEDGQMINVDKEPINLNIDYSVLEEKFYKWHFSRKKDDVLQYNVEESKIFTELWHIAILKLQKRTPESEGVNGNSMILLYNAIASNLVHVVLRDQFKDVADL